jgi:putative methyltransferase (TIGR04325 family)
MLQIIKQILPPYIFNFIKKNYGYVIKPIWEFMPNGFNTNLKSKGWEVETIVDLQINKWETFKRFIDKNYAFSINHESNMKNQYDIIAHNTLISFGFVLNISAYGKSDIKILDWGGGIGHYGLITEKILETNKVNFSYFCYDLKIFCEAGEKLSTNYTFFYNKNLALQNSYDLIFASSSLWYEQNWRLTLENLASCTNEYLYVTRMIFIEKNESYVAIQRPALFGYKTEYLCWILNEYEFLSFATSLNLSLVHQFYIGESSYIFNAPEQGVYKGFLFKKNKYEKTLSN